jgi:hypothetical protein
MFLAIPKTAILYAILYHYVTLMEAGKLQEFGNESAKDSCQSWSHKHRACPSARGGGGGLDVPVVCSMITTFLIVSHIPSY